jgi:hypothetical protein
MGYGRAHEEPECDGESQTELRCALQDKSRVTEDDLINLPYIKLIIKEI